MTQLMDSRRQMIKNDDYEFLISGPLTLLDRDNIYKLRTDYHSDRERD